MKMLSASEAEELVEHLRSRPDIWFEYKEIWIRTTNEHDPLLAITIKNGLPEGMLALTSKPLGWSTEATEEYVEWLLEKYTAYSVRISLMQALAPHIKKGTYIEALARDLCEIEGGAYVRKYARTELLLPHGDVVEEEKERA